MEGSPRGAPATRPARTSRGPAPRPRRGCAARRRSPRSRGASRRPCPPAPRRRRPRDAGRGASARRPRAWWTCHPPLVSLSSLVPPATLLDRRLLIVTGKGGVGKSTVSAALALLAARAGKRVLVCEVNAQERVAPLLGAAPAGPRVREALPGLFTVNVTPQEAMREYGLMVLRFRTIYEAVFENRLVRYFLKAVPSLAELVMLGKILNEVRSEERGRPRWDLVVVDAPATGHAVQLLRVPGALVDTVPAGPLRHDAQWMQALLVDPAITALAIVTLPEEMPVNEAIELDAQVRGVLGIPRGGLFVNAVPEARF